MFTSPSKPPDQYQSLAARAITLFGSKPAAPPALADCLGAALALNRLCLDLDRSDRLLSLGRNASRILLASCCRLLREWKSRKKGEDSSPDPTLDAVGGLYELVYFSDYGSFSLDLIIVTY